jgi:hypothetical protein
MSNYDFRTLSPTDFERLVGDLLNADLGLDLHSYPEGRDQGIDLREIASDGATSIVQCKHYIKSDQATFMKAVRKEAGKPARRMANRYLFVTSRELSPQLQDQVGGILGVTSSNVWGRHALNDALGRNPDVERRHFKLWLTSTAALESIINAGRWQRSDALLVDVAQRAKYWAETPAYAVVVGTLEREGVCVITGPPGVGKSFLAEMVALRAVHDGWQVIHVADGIEEAWDAVRSNTKQLFLYDDFLGQAELKATATSEATSLVNFLAHVRRHRQDKRLAITTRDHVLSQAASAASEGLRQLTRDPPHYAITATAYWPSTRAEILFNHLYFAPLAPGEHDKLALDRRMLAVVEHPSYNPRMIEAAITRMPPQATAGEVLDQMIRTLDHPDELWAVSFDVLTPLAQSILLTLATLPPRPVPHAEIRDLTAPTSTILDWKAALKSLEPTWVKLTSSEADRPVSFSNPGCRDYVLGRLDDVDLAEEQLDRVRRLKQLVSLSQSAGLLTTGNHAHTTTTRPNLARALMARRSRLAQLTRRYLEEDFRADAGINAILCTLRDAASLLSIYGSSDISDWLLKRISDQVLEDRDPVRLATLPTANVLAIAARLNEVSVALPANRDDIVRRLIAAALASARTSRDLDAYEALPDRLRTSDIHDAARRRAAEILDVEVSILTEDSSDPDVTRDTGLDLQQRAQWYGYDIQIDTLIDRADEIPTGKIGRVNSDWSAAMQPLNDPDGDPDNVSAIFSRFRE